LAFGACRFSRWFGGVGRGSCVGRVFFCYSLVSVVLVVRCFFARRVVGKDERLEWEALVPKSFSRVSCWRMVDTDVWLDVDRV
jgi:hypothetical protein